MSTESLALVVFLFTLIFALISWVIQIFVSRRLKKLDLQPGAAVGKRSWLRPFILGWQTLDETGMEFIMTLWSVILGLTILGMGLTVYLFISLNPPG